ncbi:hypothetical protein FACS1894217_06100 [Clostridia bacterium]|nr:hypothetical protein FACS1894217_06100 [Clostridia bacterium]
MLAHWITLPVQMLINRWYINDARKILTSMPKLKVVGVTGSYGKTTMKFILNRLLSLRFETLMTPESYNTTMGVVRTIRERLKPTHEIFVTEMGARHLGDVRELCELVHPTIGVLTSVGEQHLDTFGNLETVKTAKFELVDAVLGANGRIFLNLDSEPIRNTLPDIGNVVTYAIDHAATYQVIALSVDSQGSRFTIRAPGGEEHDFTTSLLGRHNVLNVVGAVAVAHTMGVKFAQLIPAVRALPPVPHRLELVKASGYTIIDDSYNANPNGAAAALETLGLFSGHKILITPGMVELGDRAAELNREFGANAAKVCNHIILVGAKQTEPIAEGVKYAGFTQLDIVDTVQDALKLAEKVSQLDKIVLLCNDLPDNF